MQTIKNLIAAKDTENLLNQTVSDEITDFDTPTLNIEESLDQALKKFSDSGYDRLPVVDDKNRLIGSVLLSAIMRTYQTEVTNRTVADDLSAMVSTPGKPSLQLR
ncbi:unnamed protein product [marine sediment metagenome]|uniref:CBS domain-containing protein n=1 Tax=marine sediment metagenome TaxID=412755 RepID=X1TUE3_9ZZZZ